MHKEEPNEQDETFQVHAIGHVASRFDQPAEPAEMRAEESRIILHPRYADGLYRIEEDRYLDVIFYFHKSRGYELKARRGGRGGEMWGVFACRSPHRPVPLGLTTVELLRVEENQLVVQGLDALNGTPVLDMKPHVERKG